jgi:hypothetical protein
MNRNNKCYCGFQITDVDLSHVTKCSTCKFLMHKKCHSVSNMLPEEIFCIPCSIERLNPFEKISKIYLDPICLPKRQNKKAKIKGHFEIDEYNLKRIKNDGASNLYLYCIDHSIKPFKSKDALKWPKEFRIIFNNFECTAEKSEREGITLSHKAHLINSIEFVYECIESEFVILVVERQKVESIYLAHTLEVRPPMEICRKRFQEMMSAGKVAEEMISLKCPYTCKKLVEPVRGVKCPHFQCFEFQVYMKINKTRTSNKNAKLYICPICKNSTLPSDLFLDSFFVTIIEKYSKEMDNFDVFVKQSGKI